MTAVRALLVLLALSLATFGTERAWAQQELLQNRSFEITSATATAPTTVNGNNFFAAIPNWTTRNVSAPAQPEPVNVVRPHAAYDGGPRTVPDEDVGGVNYFDVNGRSGEVYQTVTLPTPGTITISAYFSTRDNIQTVGPMTLRVTSQNFGTVHATTQVSFTTADPLYSWKKTPAVTTAVLGAGTYQIQAILPNEANLDLVSAVFTPQLLVTKTSTMFSDPVNGTSFPKAIPGAVAEYTITASTRPGVTINSNSIVLIDATPRWPVGAQTQFLLLVGGSAQFLPNNSTLTSATIDYSRFDTGTDFSYVPSTAATGDANVRRFRVRPAGTMVANSRFTVTVRYVIP